MISLNLKATQTRMFRGNRVERAEGGKIEPLDEKGGEQTIQPLAEGTEDRRDHEHEQQQPVAACLV